MPKVKNSRIRSGDGFITYKESEPTDVGGLAVEEGMAGKVILQGPPGPPGKPGEPGAPGKPGAPGIGINGADGESAYDVWLSEGHTGSREDFLNWLRFDGSSYINKSEKAKPNGVATLDSKGKVPLNQLPDEMFGHMVFIGGWDASTNTPPLPDPSIENKGHYWIVTVEGDIEINGMTDWEIGDWVVSTGTEYIQVDNQNRVSSVNGKRGNVVLTASDIKGTVRSVNNQFPDEDGNVTIPEYVLPVATDTVLGGVKVDPTNSNGILISEDGQISFDSNFNVGFRPAKTWFVATNAQTDGIGSILRPFGTIETAMAVAETNDVIIVYPGVYADTNTVVDKSVAIIGFDGTEIASNLVVNAKNVVLSGFTVDSLQTSGELGKSHFKDLRFSGQKKSNYDLRIGSTNPNDILSFDNISMTGSKILVEEFAPNVWIKQADTATNTKYEIKGGKTRIIDSKHIDTIDHFEGMLAIENIESLRLLSSSADDNERLVEDMGKWGLLNHLIIEDVNFEEAIDKTGTCVYTVNLLNRNLRHVLTGDDTNEKKANDLDTRVYYEPINYLNRNIFVNGHLEGLDKAIGQIKDSISKIVTDIKPADGDGVSLVAHPEGIIKRLKAGANINLLSETNNVTISLDKNGLITSVNDALPDRNGNVVVPDATNLVKGIVTVKPGGGIKVENGMIEIDEELISSIGFSPANVYFVATNAVKEKSDGTFNRPFTTITEATAKATDKSIIVIETPGVYEENINIDNKGLILLFPKGVTTLIGSVNIKGDKNIIISNLNIDTTGKSLGVKCSDYYGNLKLLDFSINSATTDYPFIIDNGEESLAKGSIEIDNYSISAGRVTAVNYNGSLRFSRQRGRSIAIYEINTGAVFEDIESAQRIDHLSGKMYLRNIKSLGTSAFAPAIASIANDRYDDLLFIDDVNTHVGINLMADPIHSYVAKSGRCPYVVRMLTRNQEKDVWVGVDLGEKKQTASDAIGMYSPTNYSASPVQTVDLHLKGIDNALKGFVKSITSTNTVGVSIINDGAEGILKRIVPGKGISVTSTNSDRSLTIANDGVVELTNTPFISGTHSLIRNKTGDLKVFQAGQGIDISEVNGIITIGSGVSSTVASINGRTGHILLVGDGISITSSGQNINLKNLAVMELTNQVGTGRYSLIANKTGHLRTIVGGNGIEIDTSVETLTIRTDPNNTVNSVNGKNGRVVVSAGSGIEIVPTFAGFMVANTGVKTLLGTGVNEAIQLFVRADGVLKGIQPLNGIKINDKENGILEFGIDLNTIETVRTINGAFGNISLEGGSGTIITNPSPGKFVITASGEGGSVTSINNMQGDISFAVDNTMVLVPDETTGKLLMGLNADALGIQEVTVDEDGEGESLVVDDGSTSRKAILKKIKGDDVSGIIVETSDISGSEEIVISSDNIRDVVSTTSVFEDSVELISREDYDPDRTIVVKKVVAIDGLEIKERNNIISIGIEQGQGFVRTVNSIAPKNPEIGDVELTAKDVEAVSIHGDTIQGNLVFANQARIKNLLIPVSRDEPVRVADIETLIIDAGVF